MGLLQNKIYQMRKAVSVCPSQSLSEWTVYFYTALTHPSSAPPSCLTGARTSVLLARMEFAVRRPAGVSTEGNVTTWAVRASAKQALLASIARRACVQKGCMASNVTSGVPATWTTLIGEAEPPLEGCVLLKVELQCPLFGRRDWQRDAHPETLRASVSSCRGTAKSVEEFFTLWVTVQVRSARTGRCSWLDVRFYSPLMAIAKN